MRGLRLVNAAEVRHWRPRAAAAGGSSSCASSRAGSASACTAAPIFDGRGHRAATRLVMATLADEGVRRQREKLLGSFRGGKPVGRPISGVGHRAEAFARMTLGGLSSRRAHPGGTGGHPAAEGRHPRALDVTRSRLALPSGRSSTSTSWSATRRRPPRAPWSCPRTCTSSSARSGPLEDTRETPEQVLAAAAQDRPTEPGLDRGGAPPREGAPLLVQAIVYDFDHTPPAREVHVFEALLAAFEEARARGLRSRGRAAAGHRPRRARPRALPGAPGPGLLLVGGDGHARCAACTCSSPRREELVRYEGLLQTLVERRAASAA